MSYTGGIKTKGTNCSYNTCSALTRSTCLFDLPKCYRSRYRRECSRGVWSWWETGVNCSATEFRHNRLSAGPIRDHNRAGQPSRSPPSSKIFGATHSKLDSLCFILLTGRVRLHITALHVHGGSIY